MDYAKLNENLSSVFDRSCWPEGNDPNIYMNYIIDCIKTATISSSKTIPIKKQNKKVFPWMNPHLKLIINEKNKLYKKYKRNRSNDVLIYQLHLANLEVSKFQTIYKSKYYLPLFI